VDVAECLARLRAIFVVHILVMQTYLATVGADLSGFL
jgi:hypothetical protein